ncbi:MAG: poly-gamma-glutamate synthase PgsB [Lutispora sp.]|nr:poly-gamma-glutamate synthase PgsB [Lutispora sp.]
MESFIALVGALYIVYLIYEKAHNKKIRNSFKHVIHVNGTRGKSTVSRLIDAGLREAGYSVFTKTTGTSPRIIHVDGHESEIIRRGKANIKEQLKMMKYAVAESADILVIECMAVKPELQLVSQKDMLMADIGVITNARFDHLEEMGHSLDSITKALASTMPYGGVLFTADERAYPYYKELGQSTITKVLLANEKNTDFDGIDFEENVALACQVCEHLGVERQTSIRGMKKYKTDPGSLAIYRFINKNGMEIVFINALAANDPDSTLKIYEKFDIENKNDFKNKVLLINNRIDRPSRMNQYIDFTKSLEHSFDQVWITGDMKSIMKKKLIRKDVRTGKIMLLEEINTIENLQSDTLIFGVGNIVGHGKEIVKFFERAGEKHVG